MSRVGRGLGSSGWTEIGVRALLDTRLPSHAYVGTPDRFHHDPGDFEPGTVAPGRRPALNIYESGSRVGEIESDGDIYVNGSRVAKYESDGDVYVGGSRVGKVESDGDIYLGGSRVGEIESDGDLYIGGSRVGEIESDGDIYVSGSRWGEAQGFSNNARDRHAVAAYLVLVRKVFSI
jgi:cytoskeletal protein CcmA (bactofilin family)